MQHFLKSAKALTLSLRDVMRLSDEEAYRLFRKLRWPDTDGEPVCPHCGHDRIYDIATRKIFKCAACRKQFSATSGTMFNSHKLPHREYLAATLLFVNAVKGISALQLRRDLGVSYKSAFVMLHKMREALQNARGGLKLEGEVEIDGAYYGGHVRPGNTGRQGKATITKRRKDCVLTMVQRGGPSIAIVVEGETTEEVLAAARKHIQPGTIIYADEHKAYNALHALYETHRINHQHAYAEGPVSTNLAESFHSRMRRAVIGQYHHLSRKYLGRYAAEISFRIDRRRQDNGAVFAELAGLVITHPVSRQFKGYWQARGRA
ncbi:MAG TPA: IS1595 family transposase [Azospirillaceae bacterium]|nr:IS1595 family transposase [Azospirillaceae bacterium]